MTTERCDEVEDLKKSIAQQRDEITRLQRILASPGVRDHVPHDPDHFDQCPICLGPLHYVNEVDIGVGVMTSGPRGCDDGCWVEPVETFDVAESTAAANLHALNIAISHARNAAAKRDRMALATVNAVLQPLVDAFMRWVMETKQGEKTVEPPVDAERQALEARIEALGQHADFAWQLGHKGAADLFHDQRRALEAKLAKEGK